MDRLRFGIFMAPFHLPTGQSFTSALRRDLNLVKLLDELGYDEAWIGEHHSAGVETIASPEVFISHAAALTDRIRLGTGVISLPYHNPLWTADRIILLSHLLKERLMVGFGPGALPTDAAMVGIDVSEQREAFTHDIDVIMHLLTQEDPISVETPRYRLVDAVTQGKPFDDLDIVLTSIVTPSGPLAAGKHGIGLLSVGATSPEGFDVLPSHWDTVSGRAAEFGKTVDRSQWRMAGPVYIAETREQAIEDVKYGLDAWCEYTQKTIATPNFRALGESFEERVSWINDTGLGVIGTPDDAIAQIQRLRAQSGGFGAFLMLGHEWARPAAMQRHYELFADHVMPEFQGSGRGFRAAETRARERWAALDVKANAAIEQFNSDHAEDVRKARSS